MSSKNNVSVKGFPNTVSGFVWHFAKQNKWLLIALFFLVFIHRATYVFWPYSSKMVIDAFSKYVAAGSPSGELVSYVGWVFGLYLFMWLFGVSLYRCYRIVQAWLFPKIRTDIKRDVLEYTKKHSYNFYINHFAGNIVNKINDLGNGWGDIMKLIMQMFGAVILFISTFSFFSVVHSGFTAICLFWMTIHLGICFFRMKRWNKISEEASEANSVLVGKTIDSVSNYSNVKSFAGEKQENGFLLPFFMGKLKKDRTRGITIHRDYMFLGVICVAILHLPIFALMVYLYQKGVISVSDIVFVMAAVDMVSDITYDLGDDITSLTEYHGQVKQALWVTSTPIEIKDAPSAPSLKISNAEIDFKEVGFCYEGRKKELFKKFNLSVKSGEKVGVVGYSGAGKSSLIHLLLRYFDVASGSIKIDEQDIRTISQKSLREHIAFIPQDTMLFHRSIFENIRYGKPNASRAEVMVAAKKAFAHDMIMATPKGYDSLVGDRGIKLSVGQRQRIAIARAILKDAPILILDEATSALDSETEVKIQKSLELLMKGRTTIAIAHRLSTLRNMDRIIVLDAGKIVEQGSHRALLAKKGLYAHLWSMQSDGFILTSDNNE